MDSKARVSWALGLAAALWACGGESARETPEQGRDLSLAPAESVAQLSDRPAAQPATQPPATQPAQPRPQPQPRAQPPAPRPEPPMLAEGTTIELFASDSLHSRKNKKGDAVMATTASAFKDARGREVIPAGAVFLGTISDIAPAESPGGQGRMALTFNRVQFGGKTYSVQAATDTLGTVMKGRGVTAGDAAKVGAGAVVGAVAGRLIGGNKTGTAVGAAAGAAAGAGIAVATRDIDIILPAGALIRIVLTAPFTLEEIAG
ncbi:MAG: hypothetical protein HYW52_05450 [Gemmatimonadetes bacterium]|nr:hypothetical protein [Gemmatimonadota bacterium]MBI2615109.1 hypothetical protein [Gemmatimonadota bacterium]